MTPDEHVSSCAVAHQRLLDHLDRLVDTGSLDDPGVPSRLPGWTVGHVLTHLARNADSHTHVIDGALRGEVLDQYPGGVDRRQGDIAAGAARSIEALVADVRRSVADLEAAWERAAGAGWPGTWRGILVGEQPVSDLPFRRWREVEIHHADLGLPGFDRADWSPRYVTEELARRTMEWTSRTPMGMSELPAAALALPPTDRLAWLMGRATPAGLDPVRFA